MYDISSIPTTVKYKFGIQVPRGSKNAMSLDRNNKNNLWPAVIETEPTQLKNYETFIVLDSGEDITIGYQKNPYQLAFGGNNDLRHKARLVAGANWTGNDKEVLYVWILSELDFCRRTLRIVMLCM
jgi:hypothetical protein